MDQVSKILVDNFIHFQKFIKINKNFTSYKHKFHFSLIQSVVFKYNTTGRTIQKKINTFKKRTQFSLQQLQLLLYKLSPVQECIKYTITD